MEIVAKGFNFYDQAKKKREAPQCYLRCKNSNSIGSTSVPTQIPVSKKAIYPLKQGV